MRRSGLLLLIILIFPLVDRASEEARTIGLHGDYAANHGRLAEALKQYQGAFHATQHLAIGRQYLNNIGAVQLALFQYKDAERTLLRGHEMAEKAHDLALIGSISANLAGLYTQTNDLDAAERNARESLDAFSRMEAAPQRPKAMMSLAKILSSRQRSESADRLYLDAIGESEKADDWSTASVAWFHYGKSLFEDGRLTQAEHALTESYRVRAVHHLVAKDASLWALSRLHLKQGDPSGALALIDSAISIAASGASRVPSYLLYQARADAELALDDTAAALEDARKALRNVRVLRAGVIPSDKDRVGVDGSLDNCYSTLIEAANQAFAKTKDENLVRETFEASEEIRGETLEALMPVASNWRTRLPPSYWDKLAEMVAEQQRALSVPSLQVSARFSRIQTELSQMEAAENGNAHTHVDGILDRVKDNLEPGTSLLSFRLGDRSSWLWAVTDRKIKLYKLPAKQELLLLAAQFERSVASNDQNGIVQAGSRLYRDLFGHAARPFHASHRWYISLDDQLLTLSLPALVTATNAKAAVYLGQQRSLEIVPGARLLRAQSARDVSEGLLVAAGDAIYNRADPRFSRRPLVRGASWEMARLPASGTEVQFAAGLWPHSTVLTGSGMSSKSLEREIERDPAIIHIASHVVEGPGRWRSGTLVLGMTDAGDPDLLTPEEIAVHPVRCRLVVMTGCGSGSGQPLPAAGLMGLTRAWLAAGADAVLATRWPAIDESPSGLIGSFYINLLHSTGGDPAEALRFARNEVIARGGWRAEPRYWSSFFLTGTR